MQNGKSNLFMRDDTFFGVFEGLGEDLGIPSNLLRLGFAAVLWLSPLAAIGGYAVLGLVVLLTRWLVPDPRSAQFGRPAAVEAGHRSETADNDASADESLPIAA